MILKAFRTCFSFTPPPTSRKLAGSPSCSLIMSIVAIARPAPFTDDPECVCVCGRGIVMLYTGDRRKQISSLKLSYGHKDFSVNYFT